MRVNWSDLQSALIAACLGPPKCHGGPPEGCPWCAVIDPFLDDAEEMVATAGRFSA